MAFLNKGLEIVVRDERPRRPTEIAEAVEDATVDDEPSTTARPSRTAARRAAWSGPSSSTAASSTTSSTSTGAATRPTPVDHRFEAEAAATAAPG